MRYLASIVLGCSLFAAPAALSQDQAIPVSLIQLVANPEKFDTKLVSVQGYLRIGHEPRHAVEVILYLHQEDAKNLLADNSILVIPSEQMLREQEKIDRMYVVLTGVFRAPAEIKDIRGWKVWSNPGHPVGEKSTNPNDQGPRKD